VYSIITAGYYFLRHMVTWYSNNVSDIAGGGGGAVYRSALTNTTLQMDRCYCRASNNKQIPKRIHDYTIVLHIIQLLSIIN
jgi:hypothetical protein